MEKEGTVRFRDREVSADCACKSIVSWVPGSTSNYVLPKKSLKETITDVKIENFYKRSQAGETFFNDLQKTLASFNDDVVTVDNRVGSRRNANKHYLFGNTCPISSLVSMPGSIPNAVITAEEKSRSQDLAHTQCMANLDVNEADALCSIGELKETVSYIGGVLLRVVKTLRALKQVDIAYFKKQVSKRVLEEEYMAARYAIRPLFYEVAGVISAANTKISNTRQTARGYSEVNNNITTSNTLVPLYHYYPGHSTCLGYARVLTNQIESYSCRAGCLFELVSNAFSELSVWGIDKPLEALWDLTPFSFILSWFWNLSDVIGSWTHGISINPLGSWVTSRYERSVASVITEVNYFESASSVHYDFGTWVKKDYSIIGKGKKVANVELSRICDNSYPGHIHLNVRMDFPKILDLGIIGKGLAKSLFHL